MIRPPPRSARTDTLFPYTTLFRSADILIKATCLKLTAVVGKCSRNIAFTPFGVPPPHIFDKCSHNGLASAAIVICRLAANKTETFRPIRIGDMTKTIYGMGREIESKGLLFLCHPLRSEEHQSELQSLMRISYAGYCLKKKITIEVYLK